FIRIRRRPSMTATFHEIPQIREELRILSARSAAKNVREWPAMGADIEVFRGFDPAIPKFVADPSGERRMTNDE
ncbi:MAG: hypothetical protein ACE5FA_13280, partial [Dehalococcoidia bacterium]